MTVCGTCGVEHLTRTGLPACTGHSVGRLRPEIAGKACRNNPRVGQTKCGKHGANTAKAIAAGKRRETERKAEAMAIKWGVPVDTNPTDAILGQVCVWAGLELFYRDKAEALSDDDKVWGKTKQTSQDVAVAGVGIQTAEGTTHEAKPNIWIELHERASQNLVKFAAEALRAGIEERRVRLAEHQGALVADVIRRIYGDIRDALTSAGLAQEMLEMLQRVFTESAPRHLRLLTG